MRLKIHYKITIVFVILTAINLFGIYIYLNRSLKNQTYDRIRHNILKETLFVKSSLKKHSLKDLDIREIDAIANDIGSQLDVRVTIISSDGSVLGDSELSIEQVENVENHSDRPEIKQALISGKYGESKRFSTTVMQDMLYIASPLGTRETEGVVRLAISLSEIKLVSNRLKKVLHISILLSFILIVFISFIVSLIISKPVQKMSSITQSIAHGDFSRRLLVTSNDEIGDLSEAINHMSEQIKLRIDEVIINKSRLEAVLTSMSEGVMAVDLKSTVLFINQSLKEFLQVSEKIAGRKPLEIIRNIEIQEIADEALHVKQGILSREISVLIPEEKILLIHATPIKHKGIVDGAVLVFHDITELRRLSKIRQDFVANVSHELRTPISSIKGYSETLLEGALDDKENAREFLTIIHSEAERLASLIADILNLSKIESGKFIMELKSCRIDAIIMQVFSRLKKQARKKKIILDMQIPSDCPKILADERKLSQVVLNLIDNAIKYTPEGGKGKVTIASQNKGSYIQINISDTGIGIPEKDLPRIFERFYRVNKAHSKELGGTGLGLSIVKHIIQAHQGEVFVNSVLGQGSTFSFTIPKA